MTDSADQSESATAPVAPPPPPPPPPRRQQSRLTQAAAWVGIVAGVVFIVAVVFGTGFMLGAHSNGHDRGGHHRGGHDRPGMMFHRGGPPPMMAPGMRIEHGPGGPEFRGPGPQERPETPPTTAPARP